MRRLPTRFGSALLAAAALAGGLVWASVHVAVHALDSPETITLASWAPQGPLLTIEAKDFSGLLKDWTHSPEEKAWLASDNYSDFSRSRLFSRLSEAQDQFAATAGLAPNSISNAGFLEQVAGRESIFAWYDIGNLEFLYITHMPGGAAAQNPLMQLRGKFQQRQAGADTFYVRTPGALKNEGEPERTVAFAVRGDYLLLATREDLLAGALRLMQQPGQQSGQQSAANEAWYTGALAPVDRAPGDLRMSLDLARIVRSPYFRSYWVQQNVSEMRQYSSAVTDLYRTPENFREERTLVPAAPGPVPAAAPSPADMSPALAYLPAEAGVYRAVAHPDGDRVLAAFSEKLFPRASSAYRDRHIAPVVNLSAGQAGSSTDFETRIDALPLPVDSPAAAFTPLRNAIAAATVEVMLTASSTGNAQDGVFIPVHSVLVLSAAVAWDADTIQAALTEAMRAKLTAGANGLQWEEKQHGALRIFELRGLEPLAFAIDDKVCIIATDAATLQQSLAAAGKAQASTPRTATVIAGFSHSAEREHFARMTALLNHNANSAQKGTADPDAPQSTPESQVNRVPHSSQPHRDEWDPAISGPPPFFSRNIGSLSSAFQSLDSETFTEQPDPAAHIVRQTVLYQWHR